MPVLDDLGIPRRDNSKISYARMYRDFEATIRSCGYCKVKGEGVDGLKFLVYRAPIVSPSTLAEANEIILKNRITARAWKDAAVKVLQIAGGLDAATNTANEALMQKRSAWGC
ncbi:MAG: hypothetical protein MZW92_31260 [Comamonadaceae bacterium]|nr:hypothetical protein [Comamonadaceae bacterium]